MYIDTREFASGGVLDIDIQIGLSQRKMAGKLGVVPATLMGWEAVRHQRTGKSIELIGRVLRNW